MIKGAMGNFSDPEILGLLLNGKTIHEVVLLAHPRGSGEGTIARRRSLEHHVFLLREKHRDEIRTARRALKQ